MNFARKMTAGVMIAALALGSAATPSLAHGPSYCRAYAKDYANHRVGPGEMVVGTAGGAIGGLVLGSIIGGRHAARNGAIIGAVGGAAVTGIDTSKRWHRAYDRAYAACRAS